MQSSWSSPRSAQVDGGVDAIIDAVVVEPAAGDGFGLGVELHHLLAVRAQIAEFRTTGTGEAEERYRHRDRDVDADLADVDFALEFTRRRAALGEQASAVTERVGVDQGDGLVEGVDFQHHQHRAEDFLGVDLHLGGHAREQGRADKVAFLEALHLDVATVQLQRRAFTHAAFDQVENPLLGALGNHRPYVGARLAASVDLELLRQRLEVRQPLLGRAHQHHHRGRHATLTGSAETGTDQGDEGLLAIGIRQHHCVVLGAHHRLHAFAMLAREVVNVGADGGGADERHGLDVLVGTDAIDHILAAMYYVEHTGWHARFHRQFNQQHGRHRVLLGGFEYERVAAGDGHREHPQRDHGREVERRDPGADTQWLTQRVGINAACDVLGELSHLQGADGARVLHHFQTAKDVALGVGNGLALLGAEHDGNAFGVFTDQCLQLEHDAHTGADGRVAPGLECLLCSGDGSIDFGSGGEWHLGQNLLGRWVDDVSPFRGLRLDPLAVDQQFHFGEARIVPVQLRVHQNSPLKQRPDRTARQ